MGQTVWCVFQKLPGEPRPVLSAVCARQEVAESVVRLGEEDERVRRLPPSTWSCNEWSVLDGDLAEVEEIQRMSEALDPLRAGTLPTDDGERAAGDRG